MVLGTTPPIDIDAAIVFMVGIFCTLYGVGRIGKKPGVDPVHDARAAHSRRLLRVLGPLLIVGAILLFFAESIRPSKSPEWRTITTSDGVCRIDMPGDPTQSEGPTVKGLGKPEALQMLVQDKGEAQYNLGYSDISATYRDMPPEELLETIGKNWLIAARHMGEPQLLSERKLSENGWPGKEIVIDLDSQRLQQKWFVVKNRLYRALVATPRDDKHLQDARRFLESLRIVQKPNADKES